MRSSRDRRDAQRALRPANFHIRDCAHVTAIAAVEGEEDPGARAEVEQPGPRRVFAHREGVVIVGDAGDRHLPRRPAVARPVDVGMVVVETVPVDLDKSALVDGCNRLQAYYKVVLPVSGPGLVAGGAFTFMLCWNEFVVAQVLNTKPGTTTLPPVIAGMNGQINIDYSVIAASGFLGALPAVVLVLIFQKYMVQGLTAGSVKG